MNKQERHQKIRQIIQEHRVGTQEDIKDYLQRDGIQVTQATLSRDLREIGLLKLRDDQGHAYYSVSQQTQLSFSSAALPYISRVSRASFMLVLHTNLGEADVLANVIDQEKGEFILGTVAGADTLLVVCKDEQTASEFEKNVIASL